MDEVYIYLSSLSPHNNNSPSHFTNTLHSPISLSSNVRYQIGVVNFLHPKSYFILLRNDKESSITVKQRGGEAVHTYSPPRNIANGEEVKVILELLNFPSLRWDEGSFRCRLDIDPEETEVVFGSRLAIVLGFDQEGKRGIAPKHPRTDDGGIDYLLIECDSVVPSSFGEELLPILDAFILEGAGGRGFTSPVYKTLNTFNLSSITIKVVDQLKRQVHFDDVYSSTCVLHIRPLYNDWCPDALSSFVRWTGSSE